MLIDVATHGLLTDGLGPESIVVDLGANSGEFARQMIERFGCTVIAVEPSLPHVRGMPKLPGLRTVQAAIGPTDGWVDFHVCTNSQMSSIRPVVDAQYSHVDRVQSITFERLLAEVGVSHLDVLKVDIEGSEVGLMASLSDERLASIGQITIELHDFNGMISVGEADAIELRLCRLGFRRLQLSRTNRENVLFFNPTRCGISAVRRAWARLVTRNLLGARRVINRRR